MTEKRIHSQHPADIRGDLAVSLAFALGPDASVDEQARATGIVTSVREYSDSQQALRDVLSAFGVKVFGAALLHAIEAKSSLAGHASSMSTYEGLRHLGVTVRDLGWPQEVLSVGYREDAADGYRPCSFAAGLVTAAELGYGSQNDRCIIEHHLHDLRLFGPGIGGRRAALDGIPASHWTQIAAAFNLVAAPPVEAPSLAELAAAADVWRRALDTETSAYLTLRGPLSSEAPDEAGEQEFRAAQFRVQTLRPLVRSMDSFLTADRP